MENVRLEKILQWANLPYRKMPLELPDQIVKLAKAGKIDLRNKNLTVLDVYCLVILAEKLKKGDIALFEKLVGKNGINSEEKIRDIVPDQTKLQEKYNKIN